MDRRPGRQISSLGVSADAQGAPGAGPGHGLGVLRGLQLGGNGGQEAHVEVLLPAHNGHVRAAIGDVYAAVRQQEGYGGKLHLLGLVVEAFKGEQRHVPEPGRLRRRPHQGDIVQGGQAQLFVLLRQLAAHIPHGHGVLGVEAPQLPELLQIDVGNDAQDQAVHLVEAVLGKGQVAPPPEVVEHGGVGAGLVRHGGSLLFDYCRVLHRSSVLWITWATLWPRPGYAAVRVSGVIWGRSSAWSRAWRYRTRLRVISAWPRPAS